MFDSPWDKSLCHHLFEPDWSQLSSGERVDVVVDIVSVGSNTSLAVLLPSGLPCRVVCAFPVPLTTTCVTLFQASFVSAQTGVELCLDSTAHVRCHSAPSVSDLSSLVEVCSGMGASGLGLKQVGFRPVAAIEWSSSLAWTHRLTHPGVPVIIGDLNDSSTLIALHKTAPKCFSTMAGISCQPYSRGGSQQGGADARANTLPATCRLCHLFRCKLLIIECVVPASTNAFVRAHIQALCHQLGYVSIEIQLRLEDMWTANRFRWWIVLGHPSLALQPIPPILKSSGLVVRDLMPYVKEWPQEDLDQLLLTEDELKVFNEHARGNIRSFCVQLDSKLPTALHAWGQQATACACGCRQVGFSTKLLHEKGLFAQLLPVRQQDGSTKWRHMHPQEVAILNGLPIDIEWSPVLRLNLCAVGQLASPLQAIWVGAHVMQQIHQRLDLPVSVDPEVCISDFKRSLYQQSRSLFPPMLSATPKSTLVKILYGDDDQVLALSVGSTSTVANFLAAEQELSGVDTSSWTLCSADGTPLAPEQLLAGLTIRIRFSALSCLGSDLELHQENERNVKPAEPEQPAPEVDSPMQNSDQANVPDRTPDASVTVLPAPSPSWNPSALLSLTHKQLVQLQPPVVTDPTLCHAMRRQLMTFADRSHLRNQQGDSWGDDEIAWHLNRSLQHVKPKEVVWVDPLLSTGWNLNPDVTVLSQWWKDQGCPPTIATCVLSQHHWTPLIFHCSKGNVQVRQWDHEGFSFSSVTPLVNCFGEMCGCEHPQLSVSTRAFGIISHCGAAAIAFIDFVFHGVALPHKESHLICRHQELRSAFAGYLAQHPQVSRPWCWGNGSDDLSSSLASLLTFHGVPSAVAPSRAKLLLQSLGKAEVDKALHGSAPWKSLKTLANYHTPVVQLVLPDEQLAFRAQQSQKPKGRKTKSLGSTKFAPVQPADLDPTKLLLEAGTFCTGDEQPLEQLALNQVGPLSTGVALTTMSDARSFLKAGTLLTHQGLALLILNATEEPQTTLTWSSIRFAAKCVLNHEPMLLTGFLVQLGKNPVNLFNKTEGVSLPQVDVACARITVYRDQWHTSWEDFHNKPVKASLHHLQPLKTCRREECDCPAWHYSEDSTTQDAVLDVFRRQYFNEAGRPTDWSNAAHFAFCIRFVKSQEVALLACSGTNGLYVEPKNTEANSPSLDFQVVWLPHMDFQAITHQAQCEAHSLGIARFGGRYGVRVRVQHFQQVFQSLKPDGLFLAPGTRVNWHCGPWPFGVDRKALASVFRQWKWEARPLQPIKSVQGGNMWLVQAVDDPCQVVYNMKHGQVLVSRCKPAEGNANVPAEVIGQTSTVQMCKPASSDIDPWTLKDPWQSSLPVVGPAVGPNPAKAQLAELETRLEQSILSKLPTNMEEDGKDDRLNALEQQVSQLIGRQQVLEETVQSNQHQNIAQVQQLQAQMSAQMDMQGRKMQNMFDDQLSRMEALLSKRIRHE